MKKPSAVCFPLKDLSGGVETKQKQNDNVPQHINHFSPFPHQKLCGRFEPRPAIGANHGTDRPGPVVVTRVSGEEPRLVQNTVSTNYGGIVI